VEHLQKHYGKIQALQGISLTVQPGEIFGLLGPNGAGKSTLIRILIGLTRPSAGSVKILDLDPVRHARAVRQQIGYMPQESVLYEDLSARDNLRFFGRPHAVSNLERAIDEVLDFTQLQARADDPVYGFSGGMKQRISLACALLHHPRILFLDEPTAGVDPKLRETFWEHFRQLAAEGVTIIISTHQMDEALYCDRLAILRNGTVLACETPKNLLHSGSATVRIWQGDNPDEYTLSDYPDHLPDLLRRYQLAPSVSRIEIEQESFETIVLKLIHASEPLQPKEDR
jgi:ABC-2 type transport system ATP-binding protein